MPPAAIWKGLLDGGRSRGRLRDLLKGAYAAEEVLLCNSGTTALQIAIRASISGCPGAPVAVPAFACFDVATAAVAAEVGLVFYDVCPDTLGPDFASLTRALEAGARAVVAVHLYGIPIDWSRLESLAGRFGAIVIEDAAQGHGGTFQGRPLGTLGKLSVLSFGRGKGWTGAGGGALLARGPAGNSLVRDVPRLDRTGGLVPFGTTLVSATAHMAFGSPSWYWLPASIPWLGLGETIYHPPQSETQISSFSAALALQSYSYAAESVVTRHRRAREYDEHVGESRVVRSVRYPTGSSAGMLRYPVTLSRGIAALGREGAVRRLGVERSYPGILPLLTEIVPRRLDQGTTFPGATRLVDELVTLPTHDGVRRGDLDRVLSLLAEANAGLAALAHEK